MFHKITLDGFVLNVFHRQGRALIRSLGWYYTIYSISSGLVGPVSAFIYRHETNY